MTDFEKHEAPQDEPEAVGAAGPGYPDVGATRDGRVPTGFDPIARATVVGRGPAVFDRLVTALMAWEVHRKAGAAVDTSGPVAVGVQARIGLAGPIDSWKEVLSCQVVYVVDEPGRKGFAYGTLPGAIEEGELRFLVETDPARTDAPVTFSVDGFTRAGTERARSVAPLVRLGQEAAAQSYLAAARRIGR